MQEKIRIGTFCRYCNHQIEGKENVDFIRIPTKGFGVNRFVCMDCASKMFDHDVDTYDMEVNNSRLTANKTETKETNSRLQFAVEYEGFYPDETPVINGIPLDSELKINAYLCSEYHLFPTSDGTVDAEYKEERSHNLHGYKNRIEGISEVLDMTRYGSGQHINISCTDWTDNDGYTLKRHGEALFGQLASYLELHLDECEKVFGRTFTRYCHMTTTRFEHGYWLNIRVNYSDSCLEFRLAKFQNVNQYFYLLNFCKEVTELIDTFLKHQYETETKYSDIAIGEKIVDVFQKYASGTAHCMIERRNRKIRA